jgi:hypothetical protein
MQHRKVWGKLQVVLSLFLLCSAHTDVSYKKTGGSTFGLRIDNAVVMKAVLDAIREGAGATIPLAKSGDKK